MKGEARRALRGFLEGRQVDGRPVVQVPVPLRGHEGQVRTLVTDGQEEGAVAIGKVGEPFQGAVGVHAVLVSVVRHVNVLGTWLEPLEGVLPQLARFSNPLRPGGRDDAVEPGFGFRCLIVAEGGLTAARVKVLGQFVAFRPALAIMTGGRGAFMVNFADSGGSVTLADEVFGHGNQVGIGPPKVRVQVPDPRFVREGARHDTRP